MDLAVSARLFGKTDQIVLAKGTQLEVHEVVVQRQTDNDNWFQCDPKWGLDGRTTAVDGGVGRSPRSSQGARAAPSRKNASTFLRMRAKMELYTKVTSIATFRHPLIDNSQTDLLMCLFRLAGQTDFTFSILKWDVILGRLKTISTHLIEPAIFSHQDSMILRVRVDPNHRLLLIQPDAANLLFFEYAGVGGRGLTGADEGAFGDGEVLAADGGAGARSPVAAAPRTKEEGLQKAEEKKGFLGGQAGDLELKKKKSGLLTGQKNLEKGSANIHSADYLQTAPLFTKDFFSVTAPRALGLYAVEHVQFLEGS